MNIRAAAKELQDAEFWGVVEGLPDGPEHTDDDITHEQWIAMVGLLLAEDIPLGTAMVFVEVNAGPILAARRKGIPCADVAKYMLMKITPQ